ncbi:MAG: hypothetical protein R3C18_19625 [Planctomycetaceae bacterium]
MAVNQVACDSCGAVLKVPEKYWGKKIKCPSCKSPMAIPASPIPAPGPAQLDEDDFIDEGPNDDFLDMDVDSFEGGPTLPKKRKKKKRSTRTSSYSSSGSTYTSSGTGGGGGGGKMMKGCLMMVGAVVWFVVALAAGWFFPYTVFLFIWGVVVFFQGMSGDDD